MVDRGVVGHAVDGPAVISGGTLRDDLADLVNVRITHVTGIERRLTKGDVLTDILHGKVTIFVGLDAIRLGCAIGIVANGLHLKGEHVVLEDGVATAVIRVPLDRSGTRGRGAGVERVHEGRSVVVNPLGILECLPVVVSRLGHNGCGAQVTLAVIGHGNRDVIIRIAIRHAGNTLRRGYLGDGIGVGAGLGELNCSKVARRGRLGRRDILIAATIDTGFEVLRHGVTRLVGGKADVEGLRKIPTVEGLPPLRKGIGINRNGSDVISIHEARSGHRVASYDTSVVLLARLRKAGRELVRDLGHGVIGTCVEAIDVKGLAILNGMRRLTLGVERKLERIALGVALLILHHGAKLLVRRGGNRNLKLEALAFKHVGAQVIVSSNLGILVDGQRAGQLDVDFAVVAQRDVEHIGVVDVVPVGIDDLGGGVRGVVLLGERQAIDARDARRTCLDIVRPVVRLAPERRARREVGAHEARDAVLLRNLPALGILGVIRAFVIIDVARMRLGHQLLRAVLIRVEHRVLGEVVEAVALGRDE